MSDRRIMVFGATGKTGTQIVRQALEAGHNVTAFVRNPTRLAISDPKLRVVTGDVLMRPAWNGASPAVATR